MFIVVLPKPPTELRALTEDGRTIGAFDRDNCGQSAKVQDCPRRLAFKSAANGSIVGSRFALTLEVGSDCSIPVFHPRRSNPIRPQTRDHLAYPALQITRRIQALNRGWQEWEHSCEVGIAYLQM